MLREFKEFAMKGNVLDLAIGIILGTAFGAIVKSLVQDILMPPVGLLLGKIDFANLFVSLSGQQFASLKAAQDAGAAAPTAKDCPYCLSNIPIKATRCPHCTSQL